MIIKDKIKAIAITFTLLTLTSSIFYMIKGETYDTHFHIIMRFIITAIAITSLYIYDLFKRRSLFMVHLIHYIATMTSVFILVWFTGFFVELHPNAYRDIFLNYTIIWIVVALVLTVFINTKKRRSFRI